MNNFVIDYSPLVKTLYDKGIGIAEMGKDLGLSPKTTAKIKKKESMSLTTVGKICVYLKVPIEEVVNIKY